MTETYFENLFAIGNRKDNTLVKMSAADKKAGMKIFCMEPYAQELYEFYSQAGTFATKVTKDLELEKIYSVKLRAYDAKEKVVHAVEIGSLATVFVPARELVNTSDDAILAMIQNDETIKVIVYKNSNGEIYASESKCAALTYRQDMDELFKSNTPFTVKIVDLIDGGYIALYRNAIECFLPGSQAAANVIYDFHEYLGKELQVMIENFDSSNNLYIISYKKYIKHTMSTRIHELKFGHKYTGTLTAKPYAFGMFVEWQNYFTGLVHQTEFGNDYENVCKEYTVGSKIDFYIKDISFKKNEPRIILTIDKDMVNRDRLAWQNIKDQAEGKTLDFNFDNDSQRLEVILPDDTVTHITIDVNRFRHFLKKSKQVRIDQVDILLQYVNFKFV